MNDLFEKCMKICTEDFKFEIDPILVVLYLHAV